MAWAGAGAGSTSVESQAKPRKPGDTAVPYAAGPDPPPWPKGNTVPATAPIAAPDRPAYRAWVLFMLILVYTFNFIDRQIVGILAPSIKADLDLSDFQLGLMGGPAFALFYATLGIPVARLADRWSRTGVMTIALALWSGMTAMCGLVVSYWQLFLARMGVGVGEAGGVAPAYALVADYFPSNQRARALAVYSLGIPIGSALAVGGGGVLSEALDWRTTFVIVGLMGVALAPLFRLTVREPVRGRFDPPAASGDTAHPGFADVLKVLVTKRSFWLLSLGGASSSMMGYGLIFWLPSFFVRSFGDVLPGFFAWMPAVMLPTDPGAISFAGYFYAGILIIGGTLGVWFGGLLADKLGARDRSAYARVPAIAFAVIIPFFVVGVLSASPFLAFIAFLIPQALSLMWLGPVLSAFQHLVPPRMRATASAIFLLINNLIGIGLGNAVIGLLSDSLADRYGDESLRYSILVGTLFYAVASTLFFLAAKSLNRDWEG